MFWRMHLSYAVIGMTALMTVAGCASNRSIPPDPDTAVNEVLHEKVQATLDRFREQDPTIKTFFESSRGYVVFPDITKGAAGFGGAYGRGEVYEQDDLVGYASVSQGTIGAQLGGQVFRQIIFFKDKHALREFQRENLEFSANASAVAASKGAAANASYENGVAVFTMAKGGLMFEASIGGQKFSYVPVQRDDEQ